MRGPLSLRNNPEQSLKPSEEAILSNRVPLKVRGQRDQGSHLWRSDTGCQIVSGSRRVQTIIVGRLMDAGDVVEISVCIQVKQQVEQRVRVPNPGVIAAVVVSDNRRP
jgi:hypothetical protein